MARGRAPLCAVFALLAVFFAPRAFAQAPPPPSPAPLPPLPGGEPPVEAAPPAPPPPPYAAPPPPYAPAPEPPYVATPPPPPAVYVLRPPVHAPRFSLWAGTRIGLMGFSGFFYQNQLGQGETTGNYLTAAGTFEVDVGARLGRHYVPYIFWEHGFAGAGHRFDGESASASTDFVGLGFRYTAGDVNHAGFVSDLAVGLRTVTISSDGDTYKMHAYELFRLGLGAEIRFSTLFTISPMAWISGGTMSDTSGNVPFAPGQGDGLTQPTYTNGQSINDQRGYLVIGVGCGAHFDFFGK